MILQFSFTGNSKFLPLVILLHNYHDDNFLATGNLRPQGASGFERPARCSDCGPVDSQQGASIAGHAGQTSNQTTVATPGARLSGYCPTESCASKTVVSRRTLRVFGYLASDNGTGGQQVSQGAALTTRPFDSPIG